MGFNWALAIGIKAVIVEKTALPGNFFVPEGFLRA
jgi:hypothetical protein